MLSTDILVSISLIHFDAVGFGDIFLFTEGLVHLEILKEYVQGESGQSSRLGTPRFRIITQCASLTLSIQIYSPQRL
jgi:hypothetical protein